MSAKKFIDLSYSTIIEGGSILCRMCMLLCWRLERAPFSTVFNRMGHAKLKPSRTVENGTCVGAASAIISHTSLLPLCEVFRECFVAPSFIIPINYCTTSVQLQRTERCGVDLIGSCHHFITRGGKTCSQSV